MIDLLGKKETVPTCLPLDREARGVVIRQLMAWATDIQHCPDARQQAREWQTWQQCAAPVALTFEAPFRDFFKPSNPGAS